MQRSRSVRSWLAGALISLLLAGCVQPGAPGELEGDPLQSKISLAERTAAGGDYTTALKLYQARYDFDIRVIDVDRRPELEEKWGEKVPVLLDGDLEICHYYLDHEAVDARLARMK